MAFVVHSPPNFEAAQKSLGVPAGPVMTQTSATLPLYLQVTGIMNMVSTQIPVFGERTHLQFQVFAYGGAMIFPEMVRE